MVKRNTHTYMNQKKETKAKNNNQFFLNKENERERWNSKSMETESRLVVARGWSREGGREVMGS